MMGNVHGGFTESLYSEYIYFNIYLSGDQLKLYTECYVGKVIIINH